MWLRSMPYNVNMKVLTPQSNSIKKLLIILYLLFKKKKLSWVPRALLMVVIFQSFNSGIRVMIFSRIGDIYCME